MDALIERLHLQEEFLIDDRGELGAAGDVVALFDLERAYRAADARPRGQLMRRLDRSDHRLEVLDRRNANRDLSRFRRQSQGECGDQRHRRDMQASGCSHAVSYMHKT
ncbi:MAG: hypothetical protein U1E25_13570 [Methylocystis sp.]